MVYEPEIEFDEGGSAGLGNTRGFNTDVQDEFDSDASKKSGQPIKDSGKPGPDPSGQ